MCPRLVGHRPLFFKGIVRAEQLSAPLLGCVSVLYRDTRVLLHDDLSELRLALLGRDLTPTSAYGSCS